MRTATARAHANIALVKYWGKRDGALHLPATGSLSLTLDALFTTTTVTFHEETGRDALVLDGVPQRGQALARVQEVLDLVRAETGLVGAAQVDSTNDVPTAAGLASSASSFAALAAAARAAAGLSPDPVATSLLARRGSGSACRSVFGGMVAWQRGTRPDGLDSHGVPLLPPEAWDIRLVIAIVDAGPKAIGSREAMARTVETSPFYPGWLATVPADLVVARAAIAARDLDRLGALAESNALRMHATMAGARPPIVYAVPGTTAAWQALQALRQAGVSAWGTMDAGPNVKALCGALDAAAVAAALRACPGVAKVIVAAPGPGVALLDPAVCPPR